MAANFSAILFLNIKKKKDKNTLYYIDFQENDNNNFKITDILEEIKPFLIPKDMKIKIDKVSDYCKYTYIEDKKNKLSFKEFNKYQIEFFYGEWRNIYYLKNAKNSILELIIKFICLQNSNNIKI